MTDRRFLRANANVAEIGAPGIPAGTPQVTAQPYQCIARILDMCRSPGGPRDKQLIFGQTFHVLDTRDGVAFGYDPRDGYVGYVQADGLGPLQDASHVVIGRAGHAYEAPDFKSPEVATLVFGARLTGVVENGYLTTSTGYVPTQQIAQIGGHTADAASVAELFLGTPYLWGGNTALGIDCSGLTQTALMAAGLSCPRDSDLQARAWDHLPADAALLRGDLVFWKGHVGMMLDPIRLIHANAHHMRVEIEPLAEAATRIAAKEFGAITGRARPY